jgi:broad specificity phosphatase PhoE
VQGVLDLPLSDRGRVEVARLAEQMRGRPLDALYHGPGEHVVATAEAVGRAVGVRPKRMEELRNLDQGLWQGLLVEEIRRRNPRVFRLWLEEPMTICPPRGESIPEAQARLRGALRALLGRPRQARVGLVLADPAAEVVAACLRPRSELHFSETGRTGTFEQFQVDLDQFRSGDA